MHNFVVRKNAEQSRMDSTEICLRVNKVNARVIKDRILDEDAYEEYKSFEMAQKIERYHYLARKSKFHGTTKERQGIIDFGKNCKSYIVRQSKLLDAPLRKQRSTNSVQSCSMEQMLDNIKQSKKIEYRQKLRATSLKLRMTQSPYQTKSVNKSIQFQKKDSRILIDTKNTTKPFSYVFTNFHNDFLKSKSKEYLRVKPKQKKNKSRLEKKMFKTFQLRGSNISKDMIGLLQKIKGDPKNDIADKSAEQSSEDQNTPRAEIQNLKIESDRLSSTQTHQYFKPIGKKLQNKSNEVKEIQLTSTKKLQIGNVLKKYQKQVNQRRKIIITAINKRDQQETVQNQGFTFGVTPKINAQPKQNQETKAYKEIISDLIKDEINCISQESFNETNTKFIKTFKNNTQISMNPQQLCNTDFELDKHREKERIQKLLRRNNRIKTENPIKHLRKQNQNMFLSKNIVFTGTRLKLEALSKGDWTQN